MRRPLGSEWTTSCLQVVYHHSCPSRRPRDTLEGVWGRLTSSEHFPTIFTPETSALLCDPTPQGRPCVEKGIFCSF